MLLVKRLTRSDSGVCAAVHPEDYMIEAQSLPVTGPSARAIADAGLIPSPPPKATETLRWRGALLTAIVVVNASVAAWLFLEASQLFQLAQSPTGGELFEHLTRWRAIAVQAVAAAGLLLALVTFTAFHFTERAWRKYLQAHQLDWEKEASRLRMQIAEKFRAEQHLLGIRRDLDSQVASLLISKNELQDELNRRRRAERDLAAQRQQLVASKDVLQVHVQARAQELQKLQRQYELILNAAGEGICGVEPGGRITFVNPTAAKLMGLEVTEMIGRSETDLFGELAQSDTSVMKKEAVPAPTEVTLKRADGMPFTAEFIRSHICENDRITGRVVLFKDITERKQAAEALEHKAAELTRSNAELEQFAFVASHDLQEPLRKICAFGDRLKSKCGNALPADGTDYLNRMQNAAARMQTLINDLLTFSRVISRAEPFAEVELGQVVREVLGDLEVRIEKSGATVEVGDLPTIEADAMQMRQLFQNLIGNALKFHLPGAKPKVEVRGQLVPGDYGEGPVCLLTIKDNGIGFEEKYGEKIFAVFQRLHGRQEYEGTGIGLAVCRRIVDRHRGSISAKSAPGAGAAFSIRLPVRPGHSRTSL